MLTNFGEIDADGFNQNIWEGIEEFGKRRDVFYSYVPTEVNSDNVLKSIKYAIDNGATIIVAPGYQYSNYICEAQQLYEDTYFVLIDTEPKDENDNIIYGNKTTSILFAEEESGFLAGYMAARENLNKYSFLGGLKNDNILRFNIGYLYGLFYAYDKYHDTLNLEDLKISIGYLNGFSEEKINKEVVTNVLNNTELVFVAAGSANHYVFNEANNLNIKLIGSDVNQAKYYKEL